MIKSVIYALKLPQIRRLQTSSSYTTSASLMSKKSSKKSQKTEDKHNKCENDVSVGPITKTSKGDILIKVQAKPGSKLDSITEITDEGVGVHISAAPVDGEANATLIKYMAGILGVRKSDVTLDKGSKSRSKIINILSSTNLSVDDVKLKLQKAIDSNK
ncbi:hypothetical protein CHUAL_008298 [Chamberlinius hualienensis]